MGRLARLDILVFEDGGVWLVEARQGGSEGKSRWFELADENIALGCIRDVIAVSGAEGWKELPVG